MYKLYFLISRFQKRRVQLNKKTSKTLQRIIDYIEAYYNLYIKRKWSSDNHLQLNKIKRDQKIIVSLTSYPKRIDTIWLTITSLFKQSMKPDLIVLWLAKSQFKTLDDLPESLKRLQKYGLQIKLCDDLKSHKKYYYALKEFNEDIVILADDDMFYPNDTVETLYKMHLKYPMDICTMSAQYIGSNHDTVPSKWVNTNVGENCKGKAKVTRITSAYPWRAFPITIYGTSDGSLWYVNSQDGKNDVQWQNLINYYERCTNL